MATLQSKKLKNSLTAQAHKNAMVSLKSNKETETLKKGIPVEHSRKHLDGEVPVVGMSIGSTLNMDNYQSLRVDVWLTDRVQENESVESAYARIAKVLSDTMQEVVSEYQ